MFSSDYKKEVLLFTIIKSKKEKKGTINLIEENSKKTN